MILIVLVPFTTCFQHGVQPVVNRRECLIFLSQYFENLRAREKFYTPMIDKLELKLR